MAYVEH